MEIEIDENKDYRSDLIFCNIKCHYEFTDRDSEIRKKLGWSALK